MAANAGSFRRMSPVVLYWLPFGLNLKVILEDSTRRCGIQLLSSRDFRMFFVIVLVLADGVVLPFGP